MPLDIHFMKNFLHEEFRHVYDHIESDDKARFLLPFSHVMVVLYINNEKEYLEVRIPAILQLNTAYKPAVLEKVMNHNYSLILGKYECYTNDGELAFSATIPLDGFMPPWENYVEIIRRLIVLTLMEARNTIPKLKEMNYTGQWREENEAQAVKRDPHRIITHLLEGYVCHSDLTQEEVEEVTDIIIKEYVLKKKNKIEDFPDPFPELIRKKLDVGEGTEI